MHNLTLFDAESPNRICRGCERALPATTDYFHANKTRKTGLQSLCKDCRSARQSRRKKGLSLLLPKQVDRRCDQCSAVFRCVVGSRKRFCSKTCGVIHYRANAPRVSKTCLFCDIVFQILRGTRGEAQRKFCSVRCRSAYHADHGRNKLAAEMYRSGKTYDEIASELGIPRQRVIHAIHRYEYRTGQGVSRSTLRRRWVRGKTCLICGFDRVIQAAHIIPASAGGAMDDDNLIPLCPNHHWLFDHKGLLPEEAILLAGRVLDYQQYISEGGHNKSGSPGNN